MQTTDESITGDVIAALGACPGVHAGAIRVHTDSGKVRLEGVVDNLEEKTAADAVTREVEGVTAVENVIVVSSDGYISDLELERTATERLIQGGLADIGVRVNAGNAFLMGKAPSLAVEERAIDEVRYVQGIRDVLSELEIAPGEPLDDLSIANAVVQALSENAALELTDLEVRAKNGLVRLAGEAGDQRQVDLAEEIAAEVPGVQAIDNSLTMRSP